MGIKASRLSRARHTKNPMVTGDYSLAGQTFTITYRRTHMPKLDERGYGEIGGVPAPVLVRAIAVA